LGGLHRVCLDIVYPAVEGESVVEWAVRQPTV